MSDDEREMLLEMQRPQEEEKEEGKEEEDPAGAVIFKTWIQPCWWVRNDLLIDCISIDLLMKARGP